MQAAKTSKLKFDAVFHKIIYSRMSLIISDKVLIYSSINLSLMGRCYDTRMQ